MTLLLVEDTIPKTFSGDSVGRWCESQARLALLQIRKYFGKELMNNDIAPSLKIIEKMKQTVLEFRLVYDGVHCDCWKRPMFNVYHLELFIDDIKLWESESFNSNPIHWQWDLVHWGVLRWYIKYEFSEYISQWSKRLVNTQMEKQKMASQITDSQLEVVYFIGNREMKIIKVGKSINPQKRIKAIQTYCPYPIELVATTTLYSEKELHLELQEQKMNLEWFIWDKKVDDIIK